MKIMGLFLRVLVILGIVSAAIHLWTVSLPAAGPLVVSNTGVPYTWDPGNPVPFNPDQGGLGTLTNAAAVALVDEAFGKWGAVPTASISFSNAGALPFDVDTLGEFFAVVPPPCNGSSPVIFDEDGSLFASLGLPSGVIGFAGPDCVTITAPFFITQASAALNGKFIDGNQRNGELTPDEFKGVLVHEFGHYINLDHSQVNGHYFLGDTDDPGFVTFGAPSLGSVVTMFPFIISGANPNTLMLDDKVAVSTLYPDPSFFGATGAIEGSIWSGPLLFQGTNVVARNQAAPFLDAVSSVSGARFFPDFPFPVGGSPPPELRGWYEAKGLTPGAAYTVEMANINPALRDGSGVGPLSPPSVLPGPEEFFNGASENHTDPPDDPLDFTTISSVAGVPATGIDICINGPIACGPCIEDPSDPDFATFTNMDCELFVLTAEVEDAGLSTQVTNRLKKKLERAEKKARKAQTACLQGKEPQAVKRLKGARRAVEGFKKLVDREESRGNIPFEAATSFRDMADLIIQKIDQKLSNSSVCEL